MPCEKCVEFGGLWMETPTGLKRCDHLSPLEPPTCHPPTLTEQETTVFVEMLASIPFFPSEAGARLAIGDEMRAMCSGTEAALWLVTRMRRLYRRWPGPNEMRHVYAAKHVPWDGVQPIGISDHYPDGIPSESETTPLLIAGPKVKMIGEKKHEVIEDPKNERAIRRAAAKMPKLRSGEFAGGAFAEHLREIVTPPQYRAELPGPTPQIVTQADIDAERRKQDRQRRAAGDVE